MGKQQSYAAGFLMKIQFYNAFVTPGRPKSTPTIVAPSYCCYMAGLMTPDLERGGFSTPRGGHPMTRATARNPLPDVAVRQSVIVKAEAILLQWGSGRSFNLKIGGLGAQGRGRGW